MYAAEAQRLAQEAQCLEEIDTILSRIESLATKGIDYTYQYYERGIHTKVVRALEHRGFFVQTSVRSSDKMVRVDISWQV